MLLVFLSSGLFLGWSLGANDAANVFGTAVGTKMVRFKTAALICSIFVILGATISGAGAAHTLGKLGSVNAIAGAFMVAFSAGFTVFWMTKLKIPVSTSQAIVGAIIGWNFFTGSLTDYDSLIKIVSTWIVCPLLAAVLSIILFSLFRLFFNHVKIHMLKLDIYTRISMILVGAFGAYSLGANNIANVMGVFISVSPFHDVNVFGLFTVSSTQQLFFIGSVAIAVGVFTYSKRVMETVGGSLLKLSPEAAFIVVLSQAIVLFLFASESLESWLISNGLPSIPLVPVSSSQAVIGAVIGIGLLKGGKTIKYRVLGGIASGWVTTPIIAGIITFISLFFLQNVFDQEVSRKVSYKISEPVIEKLKSENLIDDELKMLKDKHFENPVKLLSALKSRSKPGEFELKRVIEICEEDVFFINQSLINKKIDPGWFSSTQISTIKELQGRTYFHKWQLLDALESLTDEWTLKLDSELNKQFNKDLRLKRRYIFDTFRVKKNEID